MKRNQFLKTALKIQMYLINLAIVILSLVLLQIPFFQDANNMILDLLQGDIKPRHEIVIIRIDDASLSDIGAWPWNRDIFAQALNNLNTVKPAVVGVDILFAEKRSGDEVLKESIKNSTFPIVFASKFSDDFYVQSIFKEDAESGYANFVPDHDGKIRSAVLTTNFSGECLQSFSSSVLQKYLTSDTKNSCLGDVTFGKNFSVDRKILFQYTQYPFRSFSFSDVYHGRLKSEDLKDNIILMGSTITDLKGEVNDTFVDVFGKTIPGVEVHANIINSLLEGRIQKPLENSIFIPFIIILSNFILIIYQKVKKQYLETTIFVSVIAFFFLLGLFIFEFGINWPFIKTTFILGVTYVYYIIYKYLIESKENRFVKNAFSHYINPALLKRLMVHPEELALGGMEKEVTILFSDLRGFTTLSERLTAEQLVAFINDYFDSLSEIVMRHQGTIDKYIGDAIMAFWNAPISDRKHQLHAVQAALAIKKNRDIFNNKYPDYPDINIGIGINSGNVIVGNVGGKQRFDYTLLGDEVNLASRIEELTKKYGIEVILSESVMRGVIHKNPTLIYRLLDEVVVKGKSKAVKLYQPLSNSIRNKKFIKEYGKGFDYYQKGLFQKAMRVFTKIKYDPPSKLMIDRIRKLKKKRKWDGVWSWEEK